MAYTHHGILCLSSSDDYIHSNELEKNLTYKFKAEYLPSLELYGDGAIARELGGMFSVLKIIVWSYEPAFVVANQRGTHN